MRVLMFWVILAVAALALAYGHDVWWLAPVGWVSAAFAFCACLSLAERRD